jgi:hypothetical protein
MRRKQLRVIVTGVVLFALAAPLWAQETLLSKVWVIFNKSQDDPRLVGKSGKLLLDEAGRKLIIESEEKPLEVNFDDVQKMIFEVTHTMRGGGARAAGATLLAGGLGGAIVRFQLVTNHICCFEYKAPDGSMQRYVLEVPEDKQKEVFNKLQNIFGEKAATPNFAEKAEKLEKKARKELQSKQSVSVKVDKVHHPLPDIKPDKALVVVVCPAARARDAGRGGSSKIDANGRVVAATKLGTYSFFYLDPGEYVLLSQVNYGQGIRINLEGGKDYYFTNDWGIGSGEVRSGLTRHSREIVMFYVSGAWYSDWQQK